MRDIPNILALMGVMFGMVIVGFVLYSTNISEDLEVTQLNNLTRNSALHHVDMTSRVDIGHVYLNQEGTARIVSDPAQTDADFESAVLSEIQQSAPDGSQVRFDYVTHTEGTDYPVTVYTLNEGTWEHYAPAASAYPWRPLNERESVEAIRVQYRQDGNTSNKETTDMGDPAYWTYQSTVEVNRSDFVEDKMALVSAN